MAGHFLSRSLDGDTKTSAVKRGAHGLFRRHVKRNDRVIRRLNRYDSIHRWKRPDPSRARTPRHGLAALPQSMEVRVIRCPLYRKGFRAKVLTLCTTLMDHRSYPAKELVALYLRRWDLETDLRSFKVGQGADAFTAKTPAVAVREMYSAILAYNLVRATMAKSGRPVLGLSFEQAREVLVRTCASMAFLPTEALPRHERQMLKIIAAATLDHRPRPPEPRAIVDNKRRFPLLKGSRAEWRAHHVA